MYHNFAGDSAIHTAKFVFCKLYFTNDKFMLSSCFGVKCLKFAILCSNQMMGICLKSEFRDWLIYLVMLSFFPQALVIPEKFQHILRVLNTNIDGKQKIMFALTAIKVSGISMKELIIIFNLKI